MATNPIVIQPPAEAPASVIKGFQQMSEEDLLEAWASQGFDSLAKRDALVSVLQQRGTAPTEWSRTRETSAGLYPDVMDPDFAARLYQKTEFADLHSTAVPEDICTRHEGFDTTPVQRLVARFLHPMTPYHGVLLDHGVGVGKTCTAITVAETFLDVLPNNVVTILCPQAIASGFLRTLFDIDRLVALPPRTAQLKGERWESPQCTGMTYLRLTGTANVADKAEIKKEVEGAIRKRYRIMGYLQFANWVTKVLANEVPKALEGEARERAEDALLQRLFSDHLLIVDEAHNLRDTAGGRVAAAVHDSESPIAGAASDLAEGKKLTPVLQRVLRVSEGLRLMLMTATPMYNTAPEIVFLLNLLLLNDVKREDKLLSARELFETDGSLVKGADAALRTICGRYISYMRGENPASFPLRLTPPQAAGSGLFDAYPRQSISMAEGRQVVLSPHVKRILSMLPLVIHKPDIKQTTVGRVLHKLLSRGELGIGENEYEEASDFVLDRATQIANITYPDGSYGSEGWDLYWSSRLLGRLRQFVWQAPEDEDDPDYTPSIDDVFGTKGLKGHSPKAAAIVEHMTRARGMCFAFSRYVKAGVLPLAIALERAGWTRVMADGSAFPLLRPGKDLPPVPRQCAFCTHKEHEGHTGHAFAPANFVLLTGDDTLTPKNDFKAILRYANTLQNDHEVYGGKVKVILGSQITSEGLDLKCIRENHIMDGWYHLNRIEQVIGRAVRYCSHAALPPAERNCLIYLHAVQVPDYETADLYAYRLAARKAIPIGQVQRIIKETAWDCLMNRDAVVLRGLQKRVVIDAQGHKNTYKPADMPYTSICDFQETCEFACSAKPSRGAANESTYMPVDARRQIELRHAVLKRRFLDEVAVSVHDLRQIYADIPWEIVAIGLQDILDSPRYIVERRDGSRGTLHFQNGYIVFQPLTVTDTYIPQALRHGRAYSRIPRYMDMLHKTLLEPARIDAKDKDKGKDKGEKAEKDTKDDKAAPEVGAVVSASDDPMTRLQAWMTHIRTDILPTDLREKRPIPRGLTTGPFYDGLRWVHHFLGQLDAEESVEIGAQWWSDTEWTPAQREQILASWCTATPDPDLVKALRLRPFELFQSGDLKGYHAIEWTPKKRLVAHCMFKGDEKPTRCPSNMLEDVEGAAGKAPHKETGTGPIFGFLTYDLKSNNILFKTVNKADGSWRGAQCDNTSNLTPHELRIHLIQTELHAHLSENHPLLSLLLDSNPDTHAGKAERKKRQDTLDFKHVNDLPKNHMCRYMEFLLRWMDRHRVGGKRWFLSLAESVGAGLV